MIDRSTLHFQNLTVFLLRMRTKYILNCDVYHWKDETGVFQFVFRCFPPTDPNVNVYGDMSLSKGHLGSRGKAYKNKLKDTSFIFPMTNVTILGVFRTHAQKEYGKV